MRVSFPGIHRHRGSACCPKSLKFTKTAWPQHSEDTQKPTQVTRKMDKLIKGTQGFCTCKRLRPCGSTFSLCFQDTWFNFLSSSPSARTGHLWYKHVQTLFPLEILHGAGTTPKPTLFFFTNVLLLMPWPLEFPGALMSPPQLQQSGRGAGLRVF